MRLLDRYLLRELLFPLAYCLCGFLLLWIAGDLINRSGEFQEKKLLLVDIAEYYLVGAPSFLIIVLPMALLLALLYALTNHARHHEITAMRAAGISLGRLCAPYFAVGLILSGVLFVVNEYWAPDSDERAEQILARRTAKAAVKVNPNEVRDLGIRNARDNRLWLVGSYNTETAEMINPQVIWSQPDGSRVLKAKRASRKEGVWTFYDAELYKDAPQSNMPPIRVLVTNVLAFPAFSETPEQIKSQIKIGNSISIRKARRADLPISEIRNYLRLHPNPSAADASWLYTKLQGRLAAPWTCLVVVLMAVPFGAPSGRRNVFVGVASSIVICFAYFVLQQLCLALGTGGYVPPWVAGWFPNLAFGFTGLWLMSRVR